jgi:hypothetical protein
MYERDNNKWKINCTIVMYPHGQHDLSSYVFDTVFEKFFFNLIFFKINIFFMFSNYFNILILKIIFKK